MQFFRRSSSSPTSGFCSGRQPKHDLDEAQRARAAATLEKMKRQIAIIEEELIQ